MNKEPMGSRGRGSPGRHMRLVAVWLCCVLFAFCGTASASMKGKRKTSPQGPASGTEQRQDLSPVKKLQCLYHTLFENVKKEDFIEPGWSERNPQYILIVQQIVDLKQQVETEAEAQSADEPSKPTATPSAKTPKPSGEEQQREGDGEEPGVKYLSLKKYEEKALKLWEKYSDPAYKLYDALKPFAPSPPPKPTPPPSPPKASEDQPKPHQVPDQSLPSDNGNNITPVILTICIFVCMFIWGALMGYNLERMSMNPK